MIFLSFSCKKDEEITPTEPEVVLSDNILVYESEKINNNLSLLVKNASIKSLWVDKMGNKVYEWNCDTKLGNDWEM